MSTDGHNGPVADQWKVGDRREITHTFTKDDLDIFARLTGDRNPIHMNGRFASRSAAGGQVVHGMLAASFISTLIGMEIPGPGALWNAFQVNWREKIRLGDTLRFTATISLINSALNILVLQIVGCDISDANRVFLDGMAKVTLISHKANQQSLSTPVRGAQEGGAARGQERQLVDGCIKEIGAGDNKALTSHVLSGNVIIVTGATGVLGTVICQRLACDGAKLLLWGRDHDKLMAMRGALGKSVIGVVCCDLSDMTSVTQNASVLSRSHDVFGIVHAAAAPLNNLDVIDVRSIEELRNHWVVNVLSLQVLVTAFMGSGCKTPGGFIIAVLTQAIFDTPPTKMSAYVSAKMACWSLIKSLAFELGPKGIRSNAVSPSLMETPYSSNISIIAKKVEEASNPLRRLCEPQDVAEAIAFLYNPLAGFVNGVNLPVTGGYRMP
ncbi:MAG: SDR family oxidoreductase [Desulfobacteraceae bacterium]|nr:SDR family oxidoreductase [Desulfobacteraceae bacterium]